MKLLRLMTKTIITGTLLCAATLPTAQAHDSFSLGINLGGYGYAPPVVQYYPAPATVYYGAPTVYYGAPIVRYAPAVRYQYYQGGYENRHEYRGRNRGWDDDDNGRHNGWGHGRGRWHH